MTCFLDDCPILLDYAGLYHFIEMSIKYELQLNSREKSAYLLKKILIYPSLIYHTWMQLRMFLKTQFETIINKELATTCISKVSAKLT